MQKFKVSVTVYSMIWTESSGHKPGKIIDNFFKLKKCERWSASFPLKPLAGKILQETDWSVTGTEEGLKNGGEVEEELPDYSGFGYSEET